MLGNNKKEKGESKLATRNKGLKRKHEEGETKKKNENSKKSLFKKGVSLLEKMEGTKGANGDHISNQYHIGYHGIQLMTPQIKALIGRKTELHLHFFYFSFSFFIFSFLHFHFHFHFKISHHHSHITLNRY